MERGQGKVEGLIFDMDNTLLKSRIDFGRMKREVRGLLVDSGALDEEADTSSHTTVTLIDSVRGHARFTSEVESAVWRRIAAIEEEGMAGAGLEPGAAELLEAIGGRFTLTVLTNNADSAAWKALRETGIARYFALVVGRDGLAALKPAPDGVLRVLRRFDRIPPDHWLSVGDSWIDGAAAQAAGVPFVAYRADSAVLAARGVRAVGAIGDLRELARLLPAARG